jgi:ATP-dependent Lon protease
MTNTNNKLIMLKAEKQQTEMRLKEQIKSIRYTLDALESKLTNNEKLYDSDGFQGNAVNVDVYLTKLVAYERAIELFKA